MLTPSQLTVLRQDLHKLAQIEYDAVFAELLDHYATLTEQKMADGQSFEYASAYAWADLGSGEGMQRLQDDYVKAIRQQVAARHKAIVKSYFRWPTIVVTALMAVLVYQHNTYDAI